MIHLNTRTMLRTISAVIKQKGFLTRGVRGLVEMNTQLSICHEVESLLWSKNLWGTLGHERMNGHFSLRCRYGKVS